MSKEKVSVLIPVYNAAPFLVQCLDSLLSQTYRDWEAVCVNDGSSDDSLSILRSYSMRDSRFVVTDLTQNLGLAKARNVALSKSSGDYVCMLDADDWLSDDALEKAIKVFRQNRQTDCVLFRFVLAYPDGVIKDFPSEPFVVLEGMEACRKSLSWKIHGLYMVKASIHKAYPYDDTCRVYSDENTTRIHYAVSQEVRSCAGVYYYRQHATSVTHRISADRFDLLRTKESLSRQLKDIGADRAMLAEVENQRWLSIVDVCMFLYVHHGELSSGDCLRGLRELKRAYAIIDRSLLSADVTCKFGYRPMPSWWLFCLQEWLYFTLRGIFGKNY